MKINSKFRKTVIIVLTVTAALSAAVILNRITAYVIMPAILLPAYSEPVDKTESDISENVMVKENGRSISVWKDGEKIWDLPVKFRAQDFLLEDIDHDGRKDLIVLCWKIGRFGKYRPTWVKEDEKNWSQHIFIYEIENKKVRPKWMASDIGVSARSWSFEDGKLYITDVDGEITGWIWKSWGLEKL